MLLFTLLFICFLQNYSQEALEHVQEALTLAQRTKRLTPHVFEVMSGKGNAFLGILDLYSSR